MRACTQTVCFSNMENNEMNNTDTLEKIIRHQKNKDPRISLSGAFVDATLYSHK